MYKLIENLPMKGEVFGEVWSPQGKLIETDYWQNEVFSYLKKALARATADGILRGVTGAGANVTPDEIIFEEPDYTLYRGKKVSDDNSGIDVFVGGTGAETYIEWRTYMETTGPTQISVIRLGNTYNGSDPTGVTIPMTTVEISKPLGAGIKYIIRYRITML